MFWTRRRCGVNGCGDQRANVPLYLDHELSGKELEDFRLHLRECDHCSTELEMEQELSKLLHRSRPLYTAPESLRARVASTLASKTPTSIPVSGTWLRRIADVLAPSSVNGSRLPNWRAVAVGLILVVIGFAFVPSVLQQVRAADYVDTAVATHSKFLGGNLPLEITSDSPEAITAWFDGKVPFHFQLPASQLENEGRPVYRLVGGRLVNYRNSEAALVTYRLQKETISLMVVSSDSVVAAAGDSVHSGGLTFHYHTKNGFNIVTWTNHGLTYALVSAPMGSPQHSCLICHQSLNDSSEFKRAK
jgi:mycothiol system anti-sigma-R factor